MGDEPTAMTPARSEQSVFAEAILLATPEARAALLDAACGTDVALRQRVEALLRAAEDAGDFLEEPPTDLLADTDATHPEISLSEKPGDKIGRYKLLESIGEGGCGVVYMAEQEEPVRRRVALKILKLGMDTRSVVARFEAERQALALMDHPNIAKVLDGGATQTGRPYFVMELVRGVRITDYCDEAQLSTRERLRLFVQVCQAIQHAHQKGIIHRDLKPSNILVTVNDGAPVPKVIDFGIAKATGQRLTDKTLFTQFHAFIGTPAYTSPEQAEMTSLDIDTRSDIYSLGVLLYELLTGHPPFNGEQLLSVGLDEMRRIIRHDQPPRPSTRLTNLAADRKRLGTKPEAGATDSKQSIPTGELIEAVRGDLDWIVMKCLEKDRSRRYESANGIATDIQRHLNHQPIMARPPSTMYLLQKFAQRNRAVLVMSATVLMVLVVALIALAASNARIRKERNEKDQAWRERGVALESARASEQKAQDQLFVSLQSQAQARRNSRKMGQRTDSLAALTEASRIRSTPELRDHAIAAMAMPDVEQGAAWPIRSGDVGRLAFDSLHQRYARMEADYAVSIRSLPEDRELFRWPSDAGAPAREFLFSPDGQFLAWLDQNGKLGIWRCENGKSVLNSPPEKGTTLAFSPDSRYLAVAQNESITFFDLATGEVSHRWMAQDQIHALSFHPDSRQVAVGYSLANTVAVYRLDGELVASLPTGTDTRTALAWHPDGELLAFGGFDARIQIWNVKTRRKVAALEGHANQVNFLMFHWSGEILASTSWDGTMRLWQPTPGRLLMQLPARAMGFSREDRWAGTILSSNHEAQLWSIVSSQEYRTFLNTFSVDEITLREGDISPDGALLALAASDGVRLWDVEHGREVAWLHLGDTTCVLFREEGRELLTCGPKDGLRHWPVEAGATSGSARRIGPSRQIALPFEPWRIAKGCDDRTLAIVGETAGQCLVLDLSAESRRQPLSHLNAGFIALSPDTLHAASSGWHSDLVKIWDRRTGRLIKELETDSSSVVFFTPDNRELIVAREKEFTFHDLHSFQISRRMARAPGLFPGHVAFTRDGSMMAMELAPGVIDLKEFTSGRTVARLEDPSGDRSSWMCFSPDGTQLVVVARYAGAIHRWDLRAMRARSKTMNLDWDWPEFTPPSRVESSLSKVPRPFLFQIADTALSSTNALRANP